MATTPISQKAFTGVTERESGTTGLSSSVLGVNTEDLASIAGKPFEIKIERNKDVIDQRAKVLGALAQLQKDAEQLNSVVKTARGLDPLKGVENVFRSRMGTVISNMDKTGSNYAALTANNGTPVRTFQLEIEQLASHDTIKATAAPSKSNPDSSLSLGTGNLTINGHTVAVTNSMSLNELRDAINTTIGSDANIEAKVVGTSDYRLEITPTETATSSKITISDDQSGSIVDAMCLVRSKHFEYGARDGNLTVNGTDIAITSSMTLYDIRNAINAQSTTTKVQAVVDTLQQGDLRLTLKAIETGEVMTLADDQSGGLLTDLRLSSTSGKSADDLAAKFKFDGDSTTITRPTNDITDLIDGATIKLLNETETGQVLTIGIDPNIDGIRQRVVEFVVALEKIEDFYIQQRTSPTDGEDGEKFALKGDSLLQSLMVGIHTRISGEVSGLPDGDFKSLAAIGITLGAEKVADQHFSRVELDMEKLNDAVQTSPEKVERLLSFMYTSSNSDFRIVESPKVLKKEVAGKDLTVKVWKESGGSGDITKATYTVGTMEYGATVDSNGRIVGDDGTIVQGIEVAVSSSALSALTVGPTLTATINMTEGLFDQLGHFLDENLRISKNKGPNGYAGGGNFQAHIGELTQKNEKLEATNAKLLAKAQKAIEEQRKVLDRLVQSQQKLDGAMQALNSFIVAQEMSQRR